MRVLHHIATSAITKWVFLAIALAGLVYAIAKNWTELLSALHQLNWGIAIGSVVLAIAYVFFTLWSWKIVLEDLGSKLTWKAATQLFGVSQIGKYIPGGVWNIVAAARIGKDHHIPVRRSVTAMTVSVLISLLTGAGIGVLTVLGTSVDIHVPIWLIVLMLVALVVLLTPQVLNRLIRLAFRLMKRPAPETEMSLRGLGMATVMSVISWVIAGLQIWILAIGFGMRLNLSGVLMSIGSYALAWVAGFVVVFVPAGTGVRETVLGLFFSSMLGSGAVLAIVLLSRVAMTIADVVFASAGIAMTRHPGIQSNHSGAIRDGVSVAPTSNEDSATEGSSR